MDGKGRLGVDSLLAAGEILGNAADALGTPLRGQALPHVVVQILGKATPLLVGNLGVQRRLPLLEQAMHQDAESAACTT